MKKRILTLACFVACIGAALTFGVALCNASEPESERVDHPWKGKRVAYLGDSITDPKVKATDRQYWRFLEDWLGTTSYVYAVSGRQWNDIPHQADLLKQEHGNDFDAIIVFIGTNDFNAAVPVGQWFVETDTTVLAAVHREAAVVHRRMRRPDMNATTFRGRINIALDSLKRTFPTKQIVLMTPIHRAFFASGNKNIQPDERYQNECGEYVSAYVESVKEAGNIWAVPVIDLNADCGLYPVMDEHVQYFNRADTDRLHPNREGHRRMARTIYYRLMSLPCIF